MSNIMNWPVAKDWHCEICGTQHPIMEWGFSHGHCYCTVCGAYYCMYSEYPTGANGHKGVTTFHPILSMKEEYIEPAKKMWAKECIYLDDVTSELWKKYGVR